ncbi:MAG TPA: VWA domain-containing protein [Candidatus Binatia bacterium]|nr:VWA domain-containing protein [Candidatus Binatia bacterium]
MRRAIAAGYERLAAVSRAVAERYATHAEAAWARFGPGGFARWLAAGESLGAGDAPVVDTAVAFFDVAPAAFGPGGADTAVAWAAAGRRVAGASRRLAAAYVAGTVGVLGCADAAARLAAWADAGLGLDAGYGWRGAFLAQALFDGGPEVAARLAPSEYAAWAETGALLASVVKEREFFARLPAGVAAWTDGERAAFLRLLRGLAGASPRAARAVLDGLPGAVARLDPDVRAALLGVLAAVGPGAPAPLAELVPVVGAVVQGVARAARLAALAAVGEVARAFPEAALAALRQLPRIHESADASRVRRWFDTGLAVAEGNAAVARAYFALESRTSTRVLGAASTAATLEETQGVWRKVVQMLSGAPAQLLPTDGCSLRPPLAADPAGRELPLPARIDLLPTHEENCRLYRFLAAVQAGRREFGTYDVPALGATLRDADAPELLEEMFLLADGVRVHHRLARAYPGLAADARFAGTRVLARAAAGPAPARTGVVDALFAVVLAGAPRAAWPAWLPPDVATAALALLAPLAAPGATAEDALRVARALVAALTPPAARRSRRQAEAESVALGDLGLLDPGSYGDDGGPGADGLAPRVPVLPGEAELPEGLRLALDGEGDEPPGAGRPLSLDELRRLLAAGAAIGQGTGEGDDAAGLPITDLVGKIPAEQLEALRRLLARGDDGARRPARRADRDETDDGPSFLYDEWDDVIRDYRDRWCRLREVEIAADSGEWFNAALLEYGALIPEVRRQFQRIRPETYRTIRGLEDGEDFDLGAVIDARSERRARRAPSTKLYRSRAREARDVATLFLVDMSASTDEPVATAAGAGRRIIDITKAALVVMTEALGALGDAYAIYGFSGQGRANVEFYPVKAFAEAMSPAVKARIGGIEPKRSTRMGAALRHATAKMAAVASRSKHLILLSDGFPQDVDYGDDRRSHAYGIRDTAVALREAEAAGITPFCITVDRAGHDYLREMCDAHRYVVIDDVTALPHELPKIYTRLLQRAVRA